MLRNGGMVLVFWLLAGCAPQKSLHSIVSRNDYKLHLYQGDLFKHVVYVNKMFALNEAASLYVFLEGDGVPWETRTKISTNPEPVYPLALDLMSKNNYPSVYVQRPCYVIKENNCHYKYWTNQRYSKVVVDSMVQAVKNISAGYEKVILVGYSGGGALAVLMSAKLSKVSMIITLAGNLDHRQWTKYHDYSELHGSMNAIDYKLAENIQQFHYAAQNDKNVLPQWIKSFSDKQPNSHFFMIKNSDHRCCWLKNWPDIVKQTRENYQD